MKYWLNFVLMMVSFTGLARSSPVGATKNTPALDFDISVLEDQSAPSRIKGALSWSGLTPDPENMVCFYLPYEDAEFGSRHGSMGRFETISGIQPQAILHNGQLILDVTTLGVATIKEPPDHVLRIKLPPNWGIHDRLDMRLEATVPRARFSNPYDWFFDGFLPQKMDQCNTSNFTHPHFLYSTYTHFKAHIRVPLDWTYQGPGDIGTNGDVESELTGASFAFALQKGAEKIEFHSAGIPIRFFPRSKSFKSLRSTIEKMLPMIIHRLGTPPFKSLTIVETTEVQRTGLPEIIAINKPSQAFFDKLQVDWINWRHWILLSQIVKQWYGGAISAKSPDDAWLIDGLVEFILLDVLATDQEKWDLFRPILNGKRPLSFTYLQVAEIFAGMLRQNAPFATLTDDSLHTRDGWQAQNSLLFIKQTFALRQIASKTGNSQFFSLLRLATKDWRYKRVSPRDFFDWIDHKPSPISPSLRDEIKEDLLVWWTKEGWPDFTLSEFKIEALRDGKWAANVECRQLGGVDFAPDLRVIDDTGASYSTKMHTPKKINDSWTTEILTRGRPVSATIDPDHITFDANRFDNSSESPEIVFFPGTTNTLRDDAYTILWVPYPQRRPGEALSLGIGGSIRHYLESGLVLRLEYAPATRRGSYFINQDFKWPKVGLSYNLLASHTYFNDRRLEAALTRSPLFSKGPRIALSSKIRKKGEAGKPKSDHVTYGFSAAIRPESNWIPCQPSLLVEWEKAPAAWASEFSYEKRTASALGSCLFPKGTQFRLRGFAGALDAIGKPPLTSQFRPNDLFEVGLRLDSSVMRVNHILAMEADLFLPLVLPIPKDMMILPRQMKWRLFHDLGRSFDNQAIYRSAGMGFFFPFGGDLSGAGSLTVSRISLLTILYQKVGAEVSRRPSIVFDLTGEI
jgi:hypothetical protein